MHRLASADGSEVVAEDTGLQRSFVSVESRAPRIFFVGRIAVAAVLPYHSQIIEIESGGLGICNICPACFVHQNAACRRNPRRPTQTPQPAHHLAHVDAPIAPDPAPLLP